MIEGTDWQSKDLPDTMRGSYGDQSSQGIFNNAAQAWNHNFLWQSLSPNGGGDPRGDLANRLNQDFGSVEDFRAAFKQVAAGVFGSGWTWLIDEGGTLNVVGTSNAVNPLVDGHRPLLTLNVWEHAYYVDYQNDRGGYIGAFLAHLVNWSFVADNLDGG